MCYVLWINDQKPENLFKQILLNNFLNDMTID